MSNDRYMMSRHIGIPDPFPSCREDHEHHARHEADPQRHVFQQLTVDITGVEVGEMYEVVVTTYRGLYRYRLNDIVKVVGFDNYSPRVKFITRAPRSSAEVITERDLISAMSNFEFLVGIGDGQVVEFAGFYNQQHVIIFVELNQDCTLLQRVCMEETVATLRRASQSLEAFLGSVYEGKRANGDIAPLEISIVKAGSFDGLAGATMERGTPASQYKPVKIIRSSNSIDFAEEKCCIK